MQSIEIILTDYLLDLVGTEAWSEIVLNIDMQPGVLGLTGYYMDSENLKKSLRTKPTKQLKLDIKEYHRATTSSYENRWNMMIFHLYKGRGYKRIFIWDEVQQNRIDNYNLEYKKKHPEYVIPKWHWENLESA